VNRLAIVLLGLIGCSCSDSGEMSPGAPSGGASTSAGAGGSAGAPAGAGGQAGSMPQAGTGGSSGAPGGGSAGSGGTPGGAGGGGGSGGGTTSPDVAFCTIALDAARAQYEGFRGAYTDPTSIPRSANSGTVTFVGTADWTSGFPAGSFWYLYEYSEDEAFRSAAEAFTLALDGEKTSADDHDLGFQFMNTYGHGYRLTANPAYPAVIETAAQTLSTRFNAAAGVIESWSFGEWDCPVIVDNMMNLRLLHHVGEGTGDQAMIDQAISHGEKTLENHIRPDHSSYHLVNYDSSTGAVISKLNVQGLGDESRWSRGQSWAVYGFTEMHGLSGRADFLAQAEGHAATLMAHPNMPEDKVPYWDYDAPDTQGAAQVRDASAAAILASALLELSGYAAEPAATGYRDFALGILASLSSPEYAAALGTNSHFLLMHNATGPVPGNAEYEGAINYADYYYLEALLRCRALGNQ
jgi:hypothetical protein